MHALIIGIKVNKQDICDLVNIWQQPMHAVNGLCWGQ